jgi:Outer membrane lipoprotein carrier protein LolA-like
MRPAPLILSALLTLSAPLARAAPDELPQVMRLLAARRHGQVDFVEQHFLSVLKRPVESYGVMIYDAPNRLEKRTVEPRPEDLVLDGNELTVERKGRTHVLDLAAYPSILPFIESLRATLAGDLPALERVFDVDFAGNLDRWTLSLSPRDSKVSKIVSRVRIDGSRDVLLKVEILEANGDRSLMTLRDHPAP